MKFKVGDKARVKSKEELKKVNKDVGEEFLDWANKIVTIEEIDDNGDYTIKETKKFWFFDDDLLLVDFTLDDLQFGDIVTTKSNTKYVAVDDALIQPNRFVLFKRKLG